MIQVPSTPSLLRCTNPEYGHWELDASSLETDEKIALYIAGHLSTMPNSCTPSISLLAPNTHKRRVFYHDNSLYFPQSRKSMGNTTQFQGSFKTGRRILNALHVNTETCAVTKDPRPLLLFKSISNKRDSLGQMEQDIVAMRELSPEIPNIQKMLATLHWMTRKRNEKKGFVCLEQGQELFSIIAKEMGPPPFVSIPLTQRRSWQLQMARLLSEVSKKGYSYRDCKLENFLLSKDQQTIILIDFGMCTKTFELPFFPGSIALWAPEYAFFARYVLQNLRRIPRPSPEIISLFVNEKNIVFTLGTIFLIMTLPHTSVPHLHSLAKPLWDPSFSDTHCSTKIQWMPQTFKDFVASQVPTISPYFILSKNPIQQEKRPKQVEPWILLLEKMIALDPRERLSLEEVVTEIEKVISQENPPSSGPSLET